MVIDLIKVCCGMEQIGSVNATDPDLVPLQLEKNFAVSPRGGYRVLQPELIAGTSLSTMRCKITGCLDEVMETDLVRIDLQCVSYWRDFDSRDPTAEMEHPLTAIPHYRSLITARVSGDSRNTFVVHPEALVFGTQAKLVTAALRWSQSEKYLLMPYMSNCFGIKPRYNNNCTRRKLIKDGNVHMCMGNVQGGIDASVFNRDIHLDPALNEDDLRLKGFVPVFQVKYGKNEFRALQDLDLEDVLRNFVHQVYRHDDDETQEFVDSELERLILAAFPQYEEEFTAYWAALDNGDPDPEQNLKQYVNNCGYEAIYEFYMKYLASTYIRLSN